MSANETLSQPLPTPIPTWLKVGMMALVIFALIIMTIFTRFSNNDTGISTSPPLESSAVLNNNGLDSTVTAKTEGYQSNSLLSLEEPLKLGIQDDVLEHGQQILAIQENGKINNRQISLILDQLKKLQSDFSKVPAQYDTQAIEIKHINENIASMQGSLTKQGEMLTKKATTKKTYRRKTVKTPPFILVSIDQWGDDMTAVVRYQSQLQELRTGQALGQWHVRNINLFNSSVTFRHANGDSKTLSIKS